MNFEFTKPAIWLVWALLFGVVACVIVALPPDAALLFSGALTLFALAHARLRDQAGEQEPLLLFALTCAVFVWLRPYIAMTSDEFDLHFIDVLGGISVSAERLILYKLFVAYAMAAFATMALVVNCCSPQGAHMAPDAPPPVSGLRFWRFCFWIGAGFSLLQAALYVLYFVRGGSYFDLYANGHDAVGFPGLLVLASFMFFGFIGLFVFSPPEKRPGGGLIAVFCVVSILSLAKGNRGLVFTELLTGLWLVQFKRGRKIPLRSFLLVGLGLFVLATIVSYARSEEKSARTLAFSGKAMKWFAYSQGLSGELMAPGSEYFGVTGRNARFLVSPLLNPARRVIDPSFAVQSSQNGETSANFASALAYRVSPALFLEGHGAGSSCFVEIYCAAGMLGVILISALLAYGILMFTRRSRHSCESLYLLSAMLPFILFIPRESLVFFIFPGVKAMFFRLMAKDWEN